MSPESYERRAKESGESRERERFLEFKKTRATEIEIPTTMKRIYSDAYSVSHQREVEEQGRALLLYC